MWSWGTCLPKRGPGQNPSRGGSGSTKFTGRKRSTLWPMRRSTSQWPLWKNHSRAAASRSRHANTFASSKFEMVLINWKHFWCVPLFEQDYSLRWFWHCKKMCCFWHDIGLRWIGHDQQNQKTSWTGRRRFLAGHRPSQLQCPDWRLVGCDFASSRSECLSSKLFPTWQHQRCHELQVTYR